MKDVLLKRCLPGARRYTNDLETLIFWTAAVYCGLVRTDFPIFFNTLTEGGLPPGQNKAGFVAVAMIPCMDTPPTAPYLRHKQYKIY